MGKALLVLEDGTSYWGMSCGAEGETTGELCFNTSMIGYPEVISDPSYAGQIITMTYPQIGNYGVCRADLQRTTLSLRGLVVRDMCEEPSNYRSDLSLPAFLKEENIVAISEIDTRALTRHIRSKGSLRAGISTLDLDEQSLLVKVQQSPGLSGRNLAQEVSIKEPLLLSEEDETQDLAKETPLAKIPSLTEKTSLAGETSLTGKSSLAEESSLAKENLPQEKTLVQQHFKVVAYDCGAKRGILHSLMHLGCTVELVPWNTPASEVLGRQPQGVFFSNGPGDPEPVEETIAAARELLGKVPLFGICLGHQILGKAAGASTEKLRFGHHGGNHPVMNLLTQKVEITAQNHGYGIKFESLGALLPEFCGGEDTHQTDLRFWANKGVAPVVHNKSFGRIQLTHVNLNDGTPEGMAFLDLPAFSVQYHPEASPGPSDSSDLFAAFTRLMNGEQNYLASSQTSTRREGSK